MTSSAEVKQRVQLYLYSTSGPSWPVLGRNLPLPFTLRLKPNSLVLNLLNLAVSNFLSHTYSYKRAVVFPELPKPSTRHLSPVYVVIPEPELLIQETKTVLVIPPW